MEKKGYFFTLDAMLSLGILVLGAFLLFTSFTATPSSVQTGMLSESVLDSLTLTKIENLDSPYAGIGGTLWEQGNIINQQNTLLQQIGEFYYLGKPGIAESFIANVTADIVPPQYKFELWIDNTLFYPSAPTKQHNNSKNNTNVLLSSKKLAYGILNDNLFGPYEVEVLVWK